MLWLYYGASSYHLDETQDPVLVGNDGWSGFDIVAPGDVDNNGHVDILARNKDACCRTSTRGPAPPARAWVTPQPASRSAPAGLQPTGH